MDLRLTRTWLNGTMEQIADTKEAEATSPAPFQIDTISEELRGDWRQLISGPVYPVYAAGIKPCEDDVK